MAYFRKPKKTKHSKKSVIITFIIAVIVGAAIGTLWSKDLLNWRDINRYITSKLASDNCTIKGNINSRGMKIYHMPGDEYYSATQINPSMGEKWFCSQVGALLAGWRRSKV